METVTISTTYTELIPRSPERFKLRVVTCLNRRVTVRSDLFLFERMSRLGRGLLSSGCPRPLSHTRGLYPSEVLFLLTLR